MTTEIHCRRCSQPYPATEFNAPHRPTCQSCLKERRDERAARRQAGIGPHPSRIAKPKLFGASGNSYQSRARVLAYLGFDDYRAYLASDLWKSIRERVFAVKGRKCLTCGNPASQVHHNRYRLENMSGKSLKFLVPSCGKCHRGVEFKDGEKIRQSSEVAVRHKRKRKAFVETEKEEAPARSKAWLAHRELNSQFDAMFRP